MDADRVEYIEAEVESAGLTGATAALAVAAALTLDDNLEPDDFELAVQACIEGAAEQV